MRDLQQVFDSNYKQESYSMDSWCNQIYDSYFGGCYDLMNELSNKIISDKSGFIYVKLSDHELERIITELPMDLYTASESLNKLRLQSEIVRLKYKQVRREIINKAESKVKKILGERYNDISKSEFMEIVDREAREEIFENELLIKAYDSVIARADNERSSCRELIMGAKKIWDSRRKSEESNPIGEVNTDLPDYKDVAKNQYIK